MLYSLRQRLRDEFIDIQHGQMSIFGYEMWFHELDGHAIVIIQKKHERVRKFVRGWLYLVGLQ